MPAHTTALGHSYGSLTTGKALQLGGTGVDDTVLFGSPGTGAEGNVDALGLRPGRTFVIETEDDWIANLAHLGDDPSSLAGVTMLSSAREIIDGVERSASHGHSEYLTEGTTSQYNLAAVVAGVPGRAIRARPAPPPPESESVYVPMGP